MLRFFILEDQPDILRLFKRILQTEFSGSEILTATTSNEAIEVLKTSLEEDKPFDAAILDCRVPSNRESSAEIEYTVGEAFRDNSPQTILIHFTSYVDEVSIRSDLIRKKLRFANSRIFIQKQPMWPEELILALHKSIETRLEREVQAICSGQVRGAAYGGPGRDPWTAAGDATDTANYSALCARLEELWPILSEEFQKKIGPIFGAEMKNGKIHIGVAPDTSGAVDLTDQLWPGGNYEL